MRTFIIVPLFALAACGGTSPAIVAPVQTARVQPTERPGSLNCAASLLNDNRSVVVTTSEFRNNPKGRKFSAQSTTASMPLETCGVNRQLKLLMKLRCDDGSNPFTSLDRAHEARLANVGPSGRCEGIVDKYRVPCPENNYEIFMDSYICEIDELSDNASPFAMLKVGSADLPLPINWSLLDTALEPFVATIVSKPSTKMTAISVVAIVTEAEAEAVLKEKLSAYSAPATLSLPPPGELQSTDYGKSLSVSLLWQPEASASEKGRGRLFLSFGGDDSPHMNQLHSIASDMLEVLQPNDHVVADFFQLLDGDTEITVLFQDGDTKDSNIPPESASIDVQKINGRLSFVPHGWDINSWENGFTARKTIKTGQLRYIFALSEGLHLETHLLLRDHLATLSHGTLIAYQATEERGIHTVHEHSGNRLIISSFNTPLGQMQCMLIGPKEELRKPKYGHLFSSLVKTSWAAASVEAKGGFEAAED